MYEARQFSWKIENCVMTAIALHFISSKFALAVVEWRKGTKVESGREDWRKGALNAASRGEVSGDLKDREEGFSHGEKGRLNLFLRNLAHALTFSWNSKLGIYFARLITVVI